MHIIDSCIDGHKERRLHRNTEGGPVDCCHLIFYFAKITIFTTRAIWYIQASQSDPDCGIAHSLLGFEMLRNGVPGLDADRDLVPLLVKLDELCAAGILCLI